ncbi:hypothetical protein NDU88_006368 [Pleurodeles waltl]|uniref:Uncharacterized protein n=1 Tax=Pleurodeles waltl TaxID=8319 RepID=A0AAV7X131_PLEWA|nr:hypothetical protein NDU88_006368 [Pleurodeles waltl]
MRASYKTADKRPLNMNKELELEARLMTPRPICNEDGRDVRGRRGGKAEARTKRGVAAGRLLVGLISCGKNKRY